MMRSVFLNNIQLFHSEKFIHTSFVNQFKEISIPVTWGRISGKWWGPTDCKPILCLHGFRDNCGSFDKLIPLLSRHKQISFLAIDFPGHGLSSQLPQGMLYNFLHYMIIVQEVHEYFKWTKLSLLGHSLGAIISLISTVLYPEKVDCAICIDALGPVQNKVSKESVRKSIDDFMRYSKFIGEPPTYTPDQMMQLMKTAYTETMNADSIICLLQRNIAPSKNFPGKYYFTNDPMLKVRTFFNWEQEHLLQDVATVSSPIFICEAERGNHHKYRKRFHEVVNVLKKHNKDCEFHSVDGIHHLHLNDPEKISSFIINFLDKHYTVENSNLKDLSIFSEPITSGFAVEGNDIR